VLPPLLQKFRQLHSITAGHPENVLHPGIEVSTGPLGQGISNAVGMALAEAHLAAEFNKPGSAPIVGNFTYVLCGDGCLQEGISSEASSLAGHLGLGKLIVCYDDNHITIDGSTDLSFTEDVARRYEAYGWHVQHVPEGNTDLAGIEAAIRAAQAVTDRPSLIKVTTIIGVGSEKANSHDAHGAPLGAKDLAGVKALYNFDPTKSFEVDPAVAAHYGAAAAAAAGAHSAWAADFAAYTAAHPAAAAEFLRRAEGRLPAGWTDALPRGKATDKAMATRNHSGACINAIKDILPELMGGSADLTPSNMTQLTGCGDFQAATPGGRYIRFGVREHAMAAICNGMAAYGSLLPYCATFLNFIGYAQGAVRLSSLSHFRVLYVATHDSIGLGEDGPTHQPVEMLASLRTTPNMYVYRPADASETSACYAMAIERATAPAVFALARAVQANFEGSSFEAALAGGYHIFDTAPGAASPPPAFVIAATGTEVGIAVEAAKALAAETGARCCVASMPCLEVFEAQPLAHRASVLVPGAAIVSIEASAVKGWERYAHAHVGLRSFGLSAPAADVYRELGITAAAVVAKAKAVQAHYKGAAPPVACVGPEF
jgi:transketolase